MVCRFLNGYTAQTPKELQNILDIIDLIVDKKINLVKANDFILI
jgi:hypothetical protein